MNKKNLGKVFHIDGMTCANCESRIERGLKKLPGVREVSVSYGRGTARIDYEPNAITKAEIGHAVEALGYKVVDGSPETSRKQGTLQVAGVLVALLALYFLLRQFGALNVFNMFPQATAGTGYGMLFVIGLLTSLHCVAMCGGINLSQCAHIPAGNGRFSQLRSSALYNLGRVISYTVIGGIVGAIGSVVSFSGAARGIVQLAAGVFMVIMGLNMLNLFPWLRRLNPRMPKVFARKINQEKIGKGPLIVGLLNGLMPCGPLQAMQLYALSTNSPVKGALSMLLFSLGTVPLMFGLGALSSLLSNKFTHTMMAVSAVLVLVLGVSMFQSGMSLSGVSVPTQGTGAAVSASQETETVQTVTTRLSPRAYEPISVKAGVPVEWTIQAEAKDINGCNNELIIPALNIDLKLMPGDNVITFTPEQSGVIPYSCWMGMIRSQINVTE